MSDAKLPSGWHWGVGEVTGKSETYWFYSNLRFHYRGQIYTDPGEPWKVAFYEENGLRDDGGVEVAEYPCEYGTFDSEEDALWFVVTTAKELLNY